MMKGIAFFLLYFFSLTISAQVNISGKVCDVQGNALASVVVNVCDTCEDELDGYSITNSKGEYVVSIQKPLECMKLVFSILGYETIEVNAKDVTSHYNVVMKECDIELEEVVVSGIPVRVLGDTISYDVSSIKNENDVTIEDVIRNIPGITVENNGKILYQGKGINRFYIEGMDLLSARYALATKNIKADDVSSVSVYEHHQPKRALKDIEFSEQAALNIKLKKKSLMHPVGNVSVSSGYGDDWLKGMDAAVIFLHPDYQNLSTLKFSDYKGSYGDETGVLYDEYDAMATSSSHKLIELKNQTGDAPDDLFNKDKAFMATTNNLVKIGEESTFNFMGGYMSDIVFNRQVEESRYQTEKGQDVVFREDVSSNFRNKNGWADAKFEKNADDCYFLNNLSVSGDFKSLENNIISNNNVTQSKKMDDCHINNVTDMILNVGKKVVRYNSVLSYVNTPNGSLYAGNSDSLFLSQNLASSRVQIKQRASYGLRVFRSSYLSALLSFCGCWDVIDMHRKKYDLDNSCDIRGRNLMTSIELGYSFKIFGISSNINVPFCFRNIRYRGNGREEVSKKIFPLFRASASYQLWNGMRWNLSYSQSNRVGDFTDFMVEPVSLSYRDEMIPGNGGIIESDGKELHSMMTYSNYVEGLSASMIVSQNWLVKNSISVTDVMGEGIRTSHSNAKSHMSFLSGLLHVSKAWREAGFTLSLNANVNVITNQFIRNSMTIDVRNKSNEFSLGTKKDLFSHTAIVSLRGAYEPISQKCELLGISSVYHNRGVYADVSVFPFASLECNASAIYKVDCLQNGVYARNVYVNAYVKWHKRFVEYELKADNLTNRRAYFYEQFSQGDSRSHLYHLKPIQVVLSAKFSIR